MRSGAVRRQGAGASTVGAGSWYFRTGSAPLDRTGAASGRRRAGDGVAWAGRRAPARPPEPARLPPPRFIRYRPASATAISSAAVRPSAGTWRPRSRRRSATAPRRRPRTACRRTRRAYASAAAAASSRGRCPAGGSRTRRRRSGPGCPSRGAYERIRSARRPGPRRRGGGRSVSLTSLKSSRSSISRLSGAMASRRPGRPPRPSRSWRERWLKKPVSGSRSARLRAVLVQAGVLERHRGLVGHRPGEREPARVRRRRPAEISSTSPIASPLATAAA